MLVEENSMGLQDLAKGWLDEDKLHQGCLADPLSPSSITRCHSFAQAHTCSLRLSSASFNAPAPSPSPCSVRLWLNSCVPPAAWSMTFWSGDKSATVHGPYAIGHRNVEIPAGRANYAFMWTLAILGRLIWFVQTDSPNKRHWRLPLSCRTRMMSE